DLERLPGDGKPDSQPASRGSRVGARPCAGFLESSHASVRPPHRRIRNARLSAATELKGRIIEQPGRRNRLPQLGFSVKNRYYFGNSGNANIGSMSTGTSLADCSDKSAGIAPYFLNQCSARVRSPEASI